MREINETLYAVDKGTGKEEETVKAPLLDELFDLMEGLQNAESIS